MTEERLQKSFDRGRNPHKRDEDYFLKCKAICETANERIHNIRRAKIDAYILDNYSINFDSDDLLFGRLSDSIELSDEDKELINNTKESIRLSANECGALSAQTGHRVVDFEKILRVGLKGIIAEIDAQLDKIDYSDADSTEKESVYKSMKISLEAVCRYAKRTQAKLIESANSETDETVKNRYLAMAKNFNTVPFEPCSHFYEAAQCVWFIMFCLDLVPDITLIGRFDSYMYPFYKKDIADGTINDEFVFEIIEDLYLKINELHSNWPSSVMVGGKDRHGNSVWNELTYMCVKAIKTVKLINPSVSVCYNEDMPDDLLDLCIECVAEGFTRPAIFNDKIITEGLKMAGVREDDAHEYVHSTCVEITPIAGANILVATPYVNLCKAFEYILQEKSKPYVIGTLPWICPGGGGVTKEAYLLSDVDFNLDDINTYEEFLALAKKVFAQIIASHVKSSCELAINRCKNASSPMASALINDCISLGKDSGNGGARYNFCYPTFPGMINVIDSLAAIKKAVFEEKMFTLKQLGEMCRDNFDGNENIRSYLANKCPKFGNNIEEVDAIGLEMFDFVYDELKKYKQCNGGEFFPSYFAFVMHGEMGKLTDATPDGRKAGIALSEHLGAFCGMDKNGPVSVMRSISKIDQRKGIGGIATNYRFAKNFISTEKGKKAVADFVRAFMANGCFEIQFNVLDKNDLLAAKENPEKYQTLLVRVAGYSDYFVNLSETIQNEIICRTENGAV